MVRMLIGCTRWGAQWRRLPNTIEPSMCAGDAACLMSNYLTSYCFRPHHSTAYIDAAYCYRCSVVFRSLCCDPEPCKNGKL